MFDYKKGFVDLNIVHVYCNFVVLMTDKNRRKSKKKRVNEVMQCKERIG